MFPFLSMLPSFLVQMLQNTEKIEIDGPMAQLKVTYDNTSPPSPYFFHYPRERNL